MAAPKIGVIKLNIRITKNKEIDRNGITAFLCRTPGILKILRVISKFKKEIVVLVPEIKTLIIAKSCRPGPV